MIDAENSSKRIRELDVNRGITIVLALLIVYGVLRSLIAAISTPFWYDEICTWIVIKQPTLSGMWWALQHSVDSNPPLFYLVERASAALIGNEHLALRLPSIIGFAVVLVCVFFAVKKTSDPIIALMCTATLFLTTVFDPYATEARPYSMLAACISFALVCYLRAPAGRWMFLLGTGLVLAEALHYYAIFAIVPFCCAELAYLVKERKFRLGAWLAFAAGFLPLVVFWPLLARFKAYYGAHPWARPAIGNVTPIYGWLFHTATPIGIGLAGVLSLFVFVRLLFPKMLEDFAAEASWPERILVLAFLELPFIAFVATKLAHGMLINRYALPAIFGVVMGTAYALQWLGRKGLALFAVFVLCVAGFQERSFWVTHRDHLTKPHNPVEDIGPVLTRLNRYQDLPLVISDGLDYLPLMYYASPEQARRFVTLADPPGAVQYQGNDSVDKAMLAQKAFAPLQAYEFSAFVAEHPRFLLYSRGGPFDWWPTRLMREGYVLRLLSLDSGARVYLVDKEDKLPTPQ